MSKILWESIPNVGSKARGSAKALSLACVLLDFQYKVSLYKPRGQLSPPCFRVYGSLSQPKPDLAGTHLVFKSHSRDLMTRYL